MSNNIPFDWELGDKEKTDAAMAGAHHVTTLEFTNQRLVPNAIEPRCAIGDYDDSRQYHTLYTTSQNPHVIRLLKCAFVLNLPEHKVPVVSPDVGGGFGSKICPTFPCLTVDYEAGIQHQLEPLRNN